MAKSGDIRENISGGYVKRPTTQVLRRYTNLAATIHMLRSCEITLLSPGTWDDRNDAYFMAEYKRRKNLKSLFALCFANCPETYHHWRVFSHGSDGVRVEFDKKLLMQAFPTSTLSRVILATKNLMNSNATLDLPLTICRF